MSTQRHTDVTHFAPHVQLLDYSHLVVAKVALNFFVVFVNNSVAGLGWGCHNVETHTRSFPGRFLQLRDRNKSQEADKKRAAIEQERRQAEATRAETHKDAIARRPGGHEFLQSLQAVQMSEPSVCTTPQSHDPPSSRETA